MVALLALDGSDWLETVRALASALATAVAPYAERIDVAPAIAGAGTSAGEAALIAALYLGRHAVIYLALQRWAFQWDARWWAVESGAER